MSNFIIELGQIAQRILGDTRKRIMRGESVTQIEGYLTDCRDALLHATGEAQHFGNREAVADLARAIRHTRPNAEMLGMLAVISSVDSHETRDFHRFNLASQQRLRAEIRDHQRLGMCDIEDIKLGAELALSSMRPLGAVA